MTIGGWIIMIITVGGMTSLLSWCIFRVFATPETAQHVHSHTDVGLPDIDDD